jgi:hypothetical protein
MRLRLSWRTAATFFCLIGAMHAQQTTKIKLVGTVSAVEGQTISLKSDVGTVASVNVTDATRLLRMPPGQKELAVATPIQLPAIHAGDRVLASGVSEDEGKTIRATTVVVMTASDVAQVHAQEQQAWRNGKRGVVTAVDSAARKITIQSAGSASMIQVADSASLLRYKDGSSRFSDAQPATIDQIHTGDQLQAKGSTDAAGTFVADAVIFGTFVNIAGRVQSVDTEASTVTVNDLFTKKPVTLHIMGESQLKQIPQMIAQRIAFQQRSGAGKAAENLQMAGRPIDFQQVIGRSPSITIADVHKGDAVIAVAGAASANSPAFYLVDGVEPILTASPGGSAAAALLASWNLSGSGGESE